MFLVVGKGAFMKDGLIEKLVEWRADNIADIITTAERSGFAQFGNHKILLVK